MVTAGPVISCARTIFGYIEVLRIVQLSIVPGSNGVDDPRFQVKEQCSGYVVFIISLVEKYILSIDPRGDEVLKEPVVRDSMFCTKLLPEFCSD